MLQSPGRKRSETLAMAERRYATAATSAGVGSGGGGGTAAHPQSLSLCF